jgi:cleavage and polyadenylation specificity factor subunit 2
MFTRTSPGTLARHLIDNPDLKELELEIRKRVRLEGRELEDHKFRANEKKPFRRGVKSEKYVLSKFFNFTHQRTRIR